MARLLEKPASRPCQSWFELAPKRTHEEKDACGREPRPASFTQSQLNYVYASTVHKGKRNADMNRTMKFRPHLLAVATIGVLSAVLATGSAWAQALPTPMEQEVLVKATLLTFNDANVTGNYTVLNAKLSKPFRDQFDAEKLKTSFKDFADKHIDFDVIAAKPIIPTGDAQIDSKGVLLLDGHFDTTPKKIKYQLKFIRSEGEWKPLAINVNID